MSFIFSSKAVPGADAHWNRRFTNSEDIRFWMKRPLRDDDMFLMTTTEDEWASRLGLGYDDVLEYTYDVIV